LVEYALRPLDIAGLRALVATRKHDHEDVHLMGRPLSRSLLICSLVGKSVLRRPRQGFECGGIVRGRSFMVLHTVVSISHEATMTPASEAAL